MQYKEGYLVDGRYFLTKFVGSGSFGEVWVARDNQTDLEVAIKIYISMDAQGLSDFKNEFQLSFNFNHTNLLHATYLGVNAEDRRPYLVMTYCPDGSVTKMAGQMTETQLWVLIRDVASGLAYLHSQSPSVIHQDIKPDNILILKDDYVITDFGISKQLRNSIRKASESSVNSAGAVSYMGPERFSKQYQAVKASDIWSLAATIYELATGDLPFCGMGGSMQKKGADIPELPASFSDTLNAVMMACFSVETWDRPTAAQLSDYADRYLKGETQRPSWLPAEKKAETTTEDTAVATDNGQPASSDESQTLPPLNSSVRDLSETKESEKGISAIVWVLSAVLGLAVGVILNIFLS